MCDVGVYIRGCIYIVVVTWLCIYQRLPHVMCVYVHKDCPLNLTIKLPFVMWVYWYRQINMLLLKSRVQCGRM